MQKLFTLLLAASLLFVSSEGKQGIPGEDGVNIIGLVFELEANFTL